MLSNCHRLAVDTVIPASRPVAVFNKAAGVTPGEEKNMFRIKSSVAIALALVLAGALPAAAGMSGIEWMLKMKQLERNQGSS